MQVQTLQHTMTIIVSETHLMSKEVYLMTQTINRVIAYREYEYYKYLLQKTEKNV